MATSRTVMASALTTAVKGLTQAQVGVLLVKDDGTEQCVSEGLVARWSCLNPKTGKVVSKNETSSQLAARWGYK